MNIIIFVIINAPKGTLVNNNKCEDNLCLEYVQDLIECLDNTPKGYYLDFTDEIYKKCFNTCKYCHEEGDETNNNCIECEPDLIFLNDIEDNTNCYPKCENYYYFNESNKMH